MDYFQGTVETYLRAHRSMFLNSEYCLQLDQVAVPLKGRHWYVDVVAVDFSSKTVWLCEITYSQTLAALLKRLEAWQNHWGDVCKALQRDSRLPDGFTVKPWIFIPKSKQDLFDSKFQANRNPLMPPPDFTYLEDVLPWKYQVWAVNEDPT